MKFFTLACLLVLVGLSATVPTGSSGSNGCIFILGRCVSECEEGTHAYAVGCDHKMPEPTCDEPTPKLEEVIICDYSSCYCDEPTVRDTVSGKCVTLDQCPKKKEFPKKEESPKKEE